MFKSAIIVPDGYNGDKIILDAEHMADLLWGYYPPEGQRVVCFGGYYNALEFQNVVS